MLRRPSFGSKPSQCYTLDSAELSRRTLGNDWRHGLLVLVSLGLCICGCPLAEHHFAEYLNPLAHIHADYQSIIQAVLPVTTVNKLQGFIPGPLARQYPGRYYAAPSVGPVPATLPTCVL